MDQIQAMRIFVRVVEAGTFTRAADSLALPKGTVTKQIQALESRLRVKLLNRTTRRVTVTPDGAAYYERAARLLNDFDDIEASMTNAQANPTGRLRIDVGTSVARQIILPALATFCDRYPEIQVDLGVSDRTVDLISDNVDCVIRAGELSDQSLVARRIGTLHFVTVASPAYVKRYGIPQHPNDIEKRHHVVSYFRAPRGASIRTSSGRATNTSSSTVPTACRSTRATPTWRRCSAASAFRSASPSWPSRCSQAASWSRCCPTGSASRCRSTWSIRPTAT